MNIGVILGLERMESHCTHSFVGDLHASREGTAAQHSLGMGVFVYVCDVFVIVCDSSLGESGSPDLSVGEMWAQAPVSALLDCVQPSCPLQYIYL